MGNLKFKKIKEWFLVTDKKLWTETLLPLKFGELSLDQKMKIKKYSRFSKVIGFLVPPAFYLGYEMWWFFLGQFAINFIMSSFLPEEPLMIFSIVFWLANSIFIVFAWTRYWYQAGSKRLLKRAYLAREV